MRSTRPMPDFYHWAWTADERDQPRNWPRILPCPPEKYLKSVLIGCSRHCILSPLFVDMEYEIMRTVLKTAIPIEDGTEGYSVQHLSQCGSVLICN